mgnify:CR=1 FL=1
MVEITLVGIGTGNPEHVTLEGHRAIAEADLILIPRKAAKDAAELVEATYEILPAAATVDAAVTVDAAALWDDAAGNVSFRHEVGDAKAVEAVMASQWTAFLERQKERRQNRLKVSRQRHQQLKLSRS